MMSGRSDRGGKAGDTAGGRSHLCSLRDPRTLAEFVRNLREGVYITTTEGQILDANPAFLKMFGVASLKELSRYTADQLLVDPERRAEELHVLERDGSVREYELRIRRPDGTVRTVLDAAYQVSDPETGERLYHGILVDITDRKELEERLRDAAIRDPLTGCFNRRYLAELAQRLDAEDETWGAIVIDIDHFKQYNDRFGHDVGDQALVKTARFLAAETRAEDALVRMGGDEFLLLTVGVESPKIEEIVARLKERASMSAPVSFTMGWAVREDQEPLETTIRRADRELILVRAERRVYETPRRGSPE